MATTVQSVLATFESSRDLFSEHKVFDALRRACRGNAQEGQSVEWHFEQVAFAFRETRRDDTTKENHFASMQEAPSGGLLTPEMAAYWSARAKEATHPIFRARYAGLVWDLADKIGLKKNAEMARIYVESALQIAQGRLGDHEPFAVDKLAYALDVSIGIKDDDLLARVRVAILDLEDAIAQDEMLGLWGFSFRLLLGNKKTQVLPEEEERVIERLEARLTRLLEGKGSHFAMRGMAEVLAPYYRRKGMAADSRRVCQSLVNVVDHATRSMVPSIAKMTYEQLDRDLKTFGAHDMAKAVLVKIRALGPPSMREMVTHEHAIEIPRKAVEDHADVILSGPLEDVIEKLVISRIPDRELQAGQLRDAAAKYPLTFLFSTCLVDADGRTRGNLGGLETDFDAHLALQTSTIFQADSPFMRYLFSEFIRRKEITTDILLGEMEKSTLFRPGDRLLLRRALEAYLCADALVFIHLGIPRIESALRVLVESAGGTALKPAKRNDGGYHLKTMDELLVDERVKDAYGENAAWYLRLLLTDSRGGINLRNDVCHGMSQAKSFNMIVADWVLHALLLVSLVRPVSDQPAAPGSTTE